MARFSEWTEALEAELAKPFPSSVIQTKRKGGTDISFVAWHHYVRKLNELVGPGWSMGDPQIQVIGAGEDAKLVVGLPVTIFGVTRINFGTEDEDKDDYGDAATNAWAQSFKRTCALFGMGLDMYLKGKPAPAKQEAPRMAAKGDLTLIAQLADERQIESAHFDKLSRELGAPMTHDRAQEILKWLRGLPKMEAANA